MIKKRRDQCIVFIDDCFDGQLAHLKVASLGFKVERFSSHFPSREETGANANAREQKVKDSRVIDLCARKGFLLLTNDHEMRWTHVEQLKTTDLAVVATANNNDYIDIWIEALKVAKPKMLRDFKKVQRPYFSILRKDGTLITKPIGEHERTRRNRPKEHAQRA